GRNRTTGRHQEPGAALIVGDTGRRTISPSVEAFRLTGRNQPKRCSSGHQTQLRWPSVGATALTAADIAVALLGQKRDTNYAMRCRRRSCRASHFVVIMAKKRCLKSAPTGMGRQ